MATTPATGPQQPVAPFKPRPVTSPIPPKRATLSPEFIEQMSNPEIRTANLRKAAEAFKLASDQMTSQQELFVRELLTDPSRNVAQAMLRAGYAESTAYTNGNELIRKPAVARAIREGNQKLFDRLEFTAEQVTREYINIAQVDILAIFEQDPDDPRWYLVDPERLRLVPGLGRAIREITFERVGVNQRVRVQFYDKQIALEKLGQITGLLNNKFQITTKDNQPLTVQMLDAIVAGSVTVQNITNNYTQASSPDTKPDRSQLTLEASNG